MGKVITAFLAAIGLLSTLIGLFQFFNVATLPVIAGRYSVCPAYMRNEERFLDVLKDVNASIGKLVFLDLYIDWKCTVYDNRTKSFELTFPRSVEEGKERVSYSFVLYHMAENFPDGKRGSTNIAHVRPTRNGNILDLDERKIAERFLSVPNTAIFPELMSDNGATLTFYNDSLQINPYSRINFGVEGIEDQIYGVFSVKESYLDANHNFILGPPAIDSSVIKQAKCTMSGWGPVRRFFQCPFL